MASIETIRRVTISAKTEGVDQAAASLRGLAGAEESVASASQLSERAMESVSKRVEALKRQTDDAYRARQEILRADRTIQMGTAQGLLSPAEGNQLLVSRADQLTANSKAARDMEQMKAAARELKATIEPLAHAQELYNEKLAQYDRLASKELLTGDQLTKLKLRAADDLAKVQRGGGGHSASAPGQQWQILDAAMRHSFDAIVSGQDPVRAITQQFGHLQAAMDQPGGLAAAFDKVTDMISPLRVGLVALAAGALEGVLAYNRLASEQLNVTSTMLGLGRNVGLTTAQFNEMAQGVAAAGRISVASAIDISKALAGTGRVSADNIKGIAVLTKDFAATMGTNLKGAQDALVHAFSDPQPGIEALNKQLVFLDAKTKQSVDSLFAQGKGQEAIRLAVQRMPSALASYEQATSASAQAWDVLSRKISDADHALGGFINRLIHGPSMADRVKELAVEVDRARQAAELPAAPGAPPRSSGRTSVDLGYGAPTVQSTAPLPPSRPAEQQLQQAERAFTDAEREAASQLVDRMRKAMLARESEHLQQTVSQLVPGSTEFRKYSDAQKLFESSLKDGNEALRERLVNVKDVDEALSISKHVTEGLTDAEGNRITVEERGRQINEIDRQLETEHNSVRRATLLMERQRISQATEAITQGQAFNQVQQIAATHAIQRQHTISEELRSMEKEASLYGLVGPDREKATRLLQIELQYRRAGMELSPSELAVFGERIEKTQKLAQVQTQLDKLYADFQQPARDYNNMMEAAGRRLADGAISAEQYANSVANARIKMLEAQGTPMSGLEAGFLKLERENDPAKLIEGSVSTNFNTITTGLTDIVTGSKSAKDAFSDMSKAILRQITEMAIKMAIVRPLMSGLGGLFEGLGGGAGDLSTVAGDTSEFGAIMQGLSPHALGGNLSSGGWNLVGERGPELIAPDPSNRSVVPNDVIRTLAQPAAAPNMNFHVEINEAPGVKAQVQQTQGPQGPSIRVQLINTLTEAIHSGELDGPMRQRYGASTAR